MRIVSVDPGSLGYILELEIDSPDGVKIRNGFPLSTHAELDINNLFFKLSKECHKISFAIIERPFAFSRGNGNGLLRQGENFGFVLALLKLLFPKVYLVAPKEWQSALGILQKDTKKSAGKIACNLVDECFLKPGKYQKPHEGIVDALLIGYYGYLNKEEILKGE